MTGYSDMDHDDLRDELGVARDLALNALELLCNSVESGDLFTAAAVVVSVARPALKRVKRIKWQIESGAAA